MELKKVIFITEILLLLNYIKNNLFDHELMI